MRSQADLNDDLKTAMKARDEVRLSTLRMLKAEIKNREIELRGDIDDAEFQKLVRSMVKKRNESVDAYRDAGRDELADREQAEIAILEDYLPPALDDAAIDAKIAELRAGMDAAQAAQYGPLMGAVMKALGGQADGKRVAARVKAALEG